jgi:hypothetical protein
MSNKRILCLWCRANNLNGGSDPLLDIPTPEVEEHQRPSKRLRRLQRISRANEEIRKLHAKYCADPLEVEYGVEFTRTHEDMYADFIAIEERLDGYTVKRIRGVFSSSTIRRAAAKVFDYEDRRKSIENSRLAAPKSKERDSRKFETVGHRNGRIPVERTWG